MQQCDFSSAEEPGGFPDAKQSPVQTMPLKGAVGKARAESGTERGT